MTFYISLALNAKGKKVVGSNVKVLEYVGENINDFIVNKVIADEFMPELVESIIEVKRDFTFLCPGDIVRVCTPNKEGEVDVEYGEVFAIQNNPYAKEIDVYVKDLENYTSYNAPYYERRFYFNGTQIGGSRKFKRYIEIPSEEEIERFNNAKNKTNIFNEIHDLLNYREDWREEDNLPDNFIHEYLTVDTLVEIRDILLNAKNKYEDSPEY